jgi:predicted RNA-binding protein YlqC (UPF0109 family)
VRQFLEFIIRQLVEFPDEVMLSEIPSGRTTVFRLQMRQTDVGRIIGRNGQTIRAIRALLSSAASRHGHRATLDNVEYGAANAPPRASQSEASTGGRFAAQSAGRGAGYL